ncbi:hypothetical protein ACJBX4_10760 [Streptococcus suis]
MDNKREQHEAKVEKVESIQKPAEKKEYEIIAVAAWEAMTEKFK